MNATKRRCVGALVVLTILAGACSGSDDAADLTTNGATSSNEPSAQVAEFTATQLDGEQFDSSSLEGRPTVLWFWAPWCTTCRSEAPDVIESAGEFDGTVEIIGVAGRGELDAMQQFVDQTDTGSLNHLVDDDGSIWTDFQVAAQPAFAFIDADGEIVETFVGALGKAALTERMQQLAAG